MVRVLSGKPLSFTVLIDSEQAPSSSDIHTLSLSLGPPVCLWLVSVPLIRPTGMSAVSVWTSD